MNTSLVCLATVSFATVAGMAMWGAFVCWITGQRWGFEAFVAICCAAQTITGTYMILREVA